MTIRRPSESPPAEKQLHEGISVARESIASLAAVRWQYRAPSPDTSPPTPNPNAATASDSEHEMELRENEAASRKFWIANQITLQQLYLVEIEGYGTEVKSTGIYNNVGFDRDQQRLLGTSGVAVTLCEKENLVHLKRACEVYGYHEGEEEQVWEDSNKCTTNVRERAEYALAQGAGRAE